MATIQSATTVGLACPVEAREALERVINTVDERAVQTQARDALRMLKSLRINFQPKEVAVPAGYLPDFGEVFADRGNGHTYGWSADHTGEVRRRTDDPLQGTLVHVLDGQRWELALPNGTYEVAVMIGDPQYPSQPTLYIEGVECCKNLALQNAVELVRQTVQVNDGKLTLDADESKRPATRIIAVQVEPAQDS